MMESGTTIYGENLSGTCCLDYINASYAVSSWYSEISEYNFDKPAYSPTTGHFTQVRAA